MADHPEQIFNWSWDLKSPPEALWPLVSNTDRFNRDVGYPDVKLIPTPPGAKKVTNTRRLFARVMGVAVEWDEYAFEWVAPHRFGVERRFYSGPVKKIIMQSELIPRADGGTTLNYKLRMQPASLLWRLMLPFSIGKQARDNTERVFRSYDEAAQRGLRTSQVVQKPRLTEGGPERLTRIGDTLVRTAHQPPSLVSQLQQFIATADDLNVVRIRPYVLADEWRTDRRETLHLFLHATRGGMLDFSWDLVCPHCRGAKAAAPTLDAVRPEAHCDSCDIDFIVNFDQSVELTFHPNASIRAVERVDYCVGGPQITPHVVAQQRMESGDRRTLPLGLMPGRYRVRASGLPEQHAFRVAPQAAERLRVDLGTTAQQEPAVAPGGELTIINASDAQQIALVEHLAWSDQSTTAAEVTSLQLFRDLFSREVLHPGKQISVGSMTVVFTDLKNSTQMYQDIGDAPAFGRVLTHFEILKASVAAEGGCIVKTMGDAIMAVFPRPIAALRAMLHAHAWLAQPQDFALPAGVSVPASSLKPLLLKAGIHCGPCLAINQNDRLDYFGTTVNLTARLCSLAKGQDIILSQAVRHDHEVVAALAAEAVAFTTTSESVTLRGLGDTAHQVWRITPHDGAAQFF